MNGAERIRNGGGTMMADGGLKPDRRQGVVGITGLVWVAFLVMLVAAMACYPGRDAAAGGYRFCYEFISALGVTRTPGGLDNRAACLLFNVGLGTAMVSLLPYWYVRAGCVRGPRFVRWLAFLCCAGFSLGVLGVALSPYDLRPHMHNLCIYSAFALIVPGVLLMLLGTESAFSGWRYKTAWLLFAVGLLVSEGVLTALIRHHVMPSRPVFNPLIQKANVAVFLAWVAADLWLFRTYLRRREARV